MSRCEDYPCCGCGPEGCVDRSRQVKCERCGKQYHPDPNTESVCYACQPDPDDLHSYYDEGPIYDNDDIDSDDGSATPPEPWYDDPDSAENCAWEDRHDDREFEVDY